MICPAILAFFLIARSPAAWNSRNRRRISLWSALSSTIASDGLAHSPGRQIVSCALPGNLGAKRRAPRHLPTRAGGCCCAGMPDLQC
jgi:hypothetical protein